MNYLALLLLVPSLALAQAEDTGSEGETTDESGDAEEAPAPAEGEAPAPAEASAPAEGEAPASVPTDAPSLQGDTVPAAPVGTPDWYQRAVEEMQEIEDSEAPADEPEFSAEDEALAQQRAAAERRAEEEAREQEAQQGKHNGMWDHMRKRLAKKRVPAYLVFFVGGGNLAVADPAFHELYDAESLRGARWGLDVYLHPNIAVSLGGGNNGRNDANISQDDGLLGWQAELRVASFDAGAKGVLAPAYWPVRPFVRGGGGFHHARVRLKDHERNDNLAERWYEGVAGYGTVGGGIEITTPRKIKKTEVPWGIGGAFEAGVNLGGGGDAPASPSADLGDLGRLDLGPAYLRAGLVLLF